jgi:hypothetical protein
MASVNFDIKDVKPFLSSLGLGEVPDLTPRNLNKITPPPMAPPPPTPAAAGFTDWKSDPANQQKVVSGIIPPNEPMIPPSAQMAFLNPPQRQYASLNPPQPAGTASRPNIQQPNPGPFLVPPPVNPNPRNSPPLRPYNQPHTTPELPRAASQKVVTGMTPPNTPIIPDSAKMAFLNPPKQQFASLNPPNMPVPTEAPPASTALLPYQPTKGTAPTTINSPGTQTEAEYFAANPSQQARKQFSGGGAVQNILNGIAAGTLGAAGGMKGNPGAGAEYVAQGAARDAQVPEVNNSRYRAAVVQPQIDALKAQESAATVAHTKAQTADIDAKEQQQAAQHGLMKVTDPTTGVSSLVVDPDSPVTKANADKDTKLQTQTQLIGAQIDSTKAQAELRAAQTAFNNAKTDPNSPLFKQTSQRLAIAQQNANAAGQRAQAYMGNYLKGAYNKGLNGEVLPGAPQIADDNGNITTPGSTNAPLAVKVNANAAQFNDVHGSLDNLEQMATNLVQKGGKINSPSVVAALSRPAGALGQWLQGAGIKANLSPEERAYVQSVAAAHENIQALRKSAGGTATDSAVEKLDALIPNASTPDLDYLKGQTGQIRQTAERLGKGAATASGGLTVRGQKGITAPPTGGISVTAPDGSVHPFKTQAAADRFKKLAGIK